MEYPGIFDGNLMKVKSEKIFRILNGKAAMEAKGMFKRGFVNDLRETGIQQYKTDVGFGHLWKASTRTCISYPNIRENIAGQKTRLTHWLNL